MVHFAPAATVMKAEQLQVARPALRLDGIHHGCHRSRSHELSSMHAHPIAHGSCTVGEPSRRRRRHALQKTNASSLLLQAAVGGGLPSGSISRNTGWPQEKPGDEHQAPTSGCPCPVAVGALTAAVLLVADFEHCQRSQTAKSVSQRLTTSYSSTLPNVGQLGAAGEGRSGLETRVGTK